MVLLRNLFIYQITINVLNMNILTVAVCNPSIFDKNPAMDFEIYRLKGNVKRTSLKRYLKKVQPPSGEKIAAWRRHCRNKSLKLKLNSKKRSVSFESPSDIEKHLNEELTDNESLTDGEVDINSPIIFISPFENRMVRETTHKNLCDFTYPREPYSHVFDTEKPTSHYYNSFTGQDINRILSGFRERQLIRKCQRQPDTLELNLVLPLAHMNPPQTSTDIDILARRLRLIALILLFLIAICLLVNPDLETFKVMDLGSMAKQTS